MTTCSASNAPAHRRTIGRVPEFDPRHARDFELLAEIADDLPPEASELREHIHRIIRRCQHREQLKAIGLTNVQAEILRLRADGRSTEEIADYLCLSPDAIEKHQRRAIDTLRAHAGTEAADRVRRLLEPARSVRALDVQASAWGSSL